MSTVTQSLVQIHTYHSGTAPDGRRHLALIEALEETPAGKNGGPPQVRRVMIPVLFYGETPNEVYRKAQDYWAGKLDNEARRKERLRRAAEARRRRPRGHTAQWAKAEEERIVREVCHD